MTGLTNLSMSSIPADVLLADELSGDDAVEMANLTSAQTGVPGTIFISTAMGAHGPRVKYFVQARPHPAELFGIDRHTPAVVANSLPVRTVPQMAPQVISWVSRNKMSCWISGITAIPGHSPRSTTSSNGFGVFERRLRQ